MFTLSLKLPLENHSNISSFYSSLISPSLNRFQNPSWVWGKDKVIHEPPTRYGTRIHWLSYVCIYTTDESKMVLSKGADVMVYVTVWNPAPWRCLLSRIPIFHFHRGSLLTMNEPTTLPLSVRIPTDWTDYWPRCLKRSKGRMSKSIVRNSASHTKSRLLRILIHQKAKELQRNRHLWAMQIDSKPPRPHGQWESWPSW